MLDKVIEATKDQEAFPRRAAVKAIKLAYENKMFEDRTPEVFNVLCRMMSDLDWEVKCSCLDFWKAYLESIHSPDDQLPEYAQDISGSSRSCHLIDTDQLHSLVDSGCAKSLLKAVRDCDKKVQSKACHLISTIRRNHDAVFPRSQDAADDDVPVNSGSNKMCQLNVLSEIWALDLITLTVTSNQSTDQYDVNAEALLEDILISVKGLPEMSGADEEDNAIDCY